MNARILSCLFAASLAAVVVHAESAADIRRRMEQRLGTIDSLKAQEAVGENNQGYLAVPPAGKPGNAASVIADENRDRAAVYALIAQQTGSTAENVGKARARQIAAGSRGGVWVQDESGKWSKK
jgi:uncharacterized protein YdbL (DUF1318 family)